MRRLLFIASLLLLVSMTTASTYAQTSWEQRDQANNSYVTTVGFVASTIWQTFTAGLSGPLTRVKLDVQSDPGAQLTVEIRTVDSSTGHPTGTSAAGSGTVLATASLGAVTTFALTDINFPTPPEVTDGTVYAIVAIPSGQWSWALSGASGPYPRGQAGTCTVEACRFAYVDDRDLVFETYVDAPDNTEPTGSISINNGATHTNNPNLTLNLTCTDAISGCDEMAFSIDDGVWSTLTPVAATSSVTLTAGDGVRTVSARFYDEAGNMSTSVSDTIVLDTIDPETTLTTYPPLLSNSTSTDFTFSGLDITGISSFECSIENEVFLPCQTGISYSNLSDGSHRFRVRSIDSVSNIDESPATWTWTVDATRPTVTINQADDQADPTNATSVTFDVEFSEPVNSFTSMDVNIITDPTVSYSNFTVEPVSGPASTYTVTITGASGDGTISADVSIDAATDAAGNTSMASTSTDNTVTIDQTAPTTTAAVTGTEGQQGWFRSATVELSANAPATTTYAINGGDSQTFSSPFSLTIDGIHTVTFASVDTVGNQEATKTIIVKVDGTAPVIQPLDDQTLDPTNPAGAPVTFTPLVTDNLSSAGIITTSCTDQFNNPFTNGQFAPTGTTTITCTATDLAGNTATEVFVVTVLGVETLFTDLDLLIIDLNLPSSTNRTLLTQVELAEMLAESQPGMVCMQLSVLDAIVRSQESRRRISRQDAAEIYAQTQLIRDVIGCGRAT